MPNVTISPLPTGAKRIPNLVEQAIARGALGLISDPERHTTRASATNADGDPCAGATAQAVAWSGLGAVNRVAVLEHNREVNGWRSLTRTLVADGLRHDTPHAEAVALLGRHASA